MGCFVALVVAIGYGSGSVFKQREDVSPHSRSAERPKVLTANRSPREHKGAGKAGCRLTHGSRAKKARGRTIGEPETLRLSLRDGLQFPSCTREFALVCARGEDESEKRSKMNQDDERADHEESIDAGDCDAKTGVSYRFVRAELCPAGER